MRMDRWQDRYAAKLVDATTAVRRVSRGSHVFIGSGCAEPQCLVAALAARGTSTIANVGQIDRGYEAIDVKLRGLGAHIQRVNV